MDITTKPVIDRIRFQHRILNAQAWQSCLNCSDWQDEDNLPTGCRRFQELPPPHVIVHGCENHIFDIPF